MSVILARNLTFTHFSLASETLLVLSSAGFGWHWTRMHHAHTHIAVRIPPGISWQVYRMALFSQSRHTEPQTWKPVRSLRGMFQTRKKPTFVGCDDLEGPQTFCCFFTGVSKSEELIILVVQKAAFVTKLTLKPGNTVRSYLLWIIPPLDNLKQIQR